MLPFQLELTGVKNPQGTKKKKINCVVEES